MNLNRAMTMLGLSLKETEIFVKVFELGPASIESISKATKIRRSTAYLLIKGLVEKGFLFEDLKKYGKTIFALEPEKVLSLVAGKQRQLRRMEIEIEEAMPELAGLYRAGILLPKVRVYEGLKGLSEIRKDILRQQQEILLWTNQEAERLVFSDDYHRLFIQERVRKKIPIRVLAVDNFLGTKLRSEDSGKMRETKILPKGVIFGAETYIYGNKLAILDYQKDIIGIIIESVSISASQKAIFEQTWNNIKE